MLNGMLVLAYIMFVVRFNSFLGVLMFGCVDVGDDPGKLGVSTPALL